MCVCVCVRVCVYESVDRHVGTPLNCGPVAIKVHGRPVLMSVSVDVKHHVYIPVLVVGHFALPGEDWVNL